MRKPKIINKWKRNGSQLLYENPWITVTEDAVTNPAGRPGIYGTVSFKNLAIGVVPVDDQLNTWLVGQWRYAFDAFSWEIPMGGSPKNQPALVGAQRELKEETGLLAKKWTEICKLHTSNSVTDETGYVFLAQELEQSHTEFDETEDLEIWKLPLAEAVEMAYNSQITDAISVVGLMHAARIFGV